MRLTINVTRLILPVMRSLHVIDDWNLSAWPAPMTRHAANGSTRARVTPVSALTDTEPASEPANVPPLPPPEPPEPPPATAPAPPAASVHTSDLVSASSEKRSCRRARVALESAP